MIRVAIADDHKNIRAALRALLISQSAEIEIVCEVSNGEQAVECVKRLQPHVLVMDIHMPEMGGFTATKHIAEISGSTSVILISAHRESFLASQAAHFGAKGLIPKDKVVRSLLLAIETVHRGELYFQE